MNLFLGSIEVITGALLGALIVLLFTRARKTQAVADAHSQVRAETETLKERISLRDQEVRNALQKESALLVALEQLRKGLQEEIALRSAAAEKARQIPELKTVIDSLQQQLAKLQDRIHTLIRSLSEKETLAGRIPQLEEKVRVQEEERNHLMKNLSELQIENKRLQTLLDEEHRLSSEKLRLLQEATEQLRDAFKALSSEALQSNNQAFLELAKTTLEKFQSEAKNDLEKRQQEMASMVSPIQVSLEKYDEQIQAIEQSRHEAYGSITQQIKSLLSSQQKLEEETGNLVKALRTPHVRGRWGELTLRRVVELAGMVEYCDFIEQESLHAESGRLRPDMIIKAPGHKHFVIDAKAPLQAYLEAIEAKNEDERRAHLKNHARQIRTHLLNLSSKAYWDQLETTPEFVILFIPSESIYSAALEQEPRLFEEGVNERVILSTPATLIALLRAVAYGWRQERVTENAQVISELGKSLYGRLVVLARHFEEMGHHLERSVDAYNKAVGSVESRVLSAARKFKELGTAAKDDIPELSQLEKTPRPIQSTQWPALTTGQKK